MKSFLAIAMMVLGLSFAGGVTTSKPAQAACIVGVASWDVLWIRSRPSARSRKVGAIPYNACGVRVYWGRCVRSWCRVYYRGVGGWSHTRYLR